ncbi:bifunctional terpene synthase/polyprenyl synthetase family protein [Aspergillus ibericus CBS 121593]|uniref:Terpenoid synthase n=1 Tax=Aspergillus ibericus CBS 121593 TaxID=1448316 RepID=A0A395H8L5_9EURO|nr:terpenoid synthase [Aspergillus ibericus CBS 121593]RAL02574.1 terpenoid synthase [Aspergillus ibericus CBS 121593]
MASGDIKFVHSDLVDREEVARVCATTLPVRISKYKDVAEKALIVFHRQWEAEVGFAFHGGSSPKGHVSAFFPPEIKPDRVEAFTWLLEYFCAHDDVVTTSGTSQTHPKDAPDSVGWEVRKSEASGLQVSAIKQIQSQVFLRLLKVDRNRGNLVLKAINNLSKIHETLGATDFKSWEDLLQYRVYDFGTEFSLMSIVYCCELDLTAADIEDLKSVWWPATAAAALVNDLYSFNKEVSLELPTNSTMSNAVWYLMETLNLTVSQAKELLLKEKIAPLEKQFIAKKREYLASNEKTYKSKDIAYFLEMVGLGLSGNWYWSAVANRFHRWMDVPNLAGLVPSNGTVVQFDENTATCATLIKGSSLGGMINGVSPTINIHETAKDSYHKILQQPIQYLRSVPSKNVRGTIIQALNLWLKAPDPAVRQVEALIGHLHDSSLLLDDIQDSSELRRGRPATYRVFGAPQTINAATFALTLAFEKAAPLMKSDTASGFFDEVRNLHLGQAMDLHWTRCGQCPTIAEYMEMNRLKTGALFCLASHLLYINGSFSPETIAQNDINDLMILLGQYFQARDDYINLASAQYQKEKGFAQDLDEGKFSLPLIHVMTHSPNSVLLQNILCERARHSGLSDDLKRLILDEMQDQGSLTFTEETLRSLEGKIEQQMELIERSTGVANYIFQFLLDRLKEM